jgi:hypothetical protein
MTPTEFLCQVPILARVPPLWDGQRFYLFDVPEGRTLVLAWDEYYAERAAERWYGAGSGASVVRNEDGESISLSFPVLMLGPMAYLMAYLDATLVLNGDSSAMRAPDASPALTMEEAFLVDACGVGKHKSSGCPRMDSLARSAVARRDRYLARNGLLWTSSPTPNGCRGTGSAPPPTGRRDGVFRRRSRGRSMAALGVRADLSERKPTPSAVPHEVNCTVTGDVGADDAGPWEDEY